MAPKGSSQDRLAEYRRKRSADRTPEPFVGAPHARGLFVVQKHAATRLHYDLRLEMHGALQSWAVPKGPSFDPTVKRMAVEVEEHPLEYAYFEGLIPDGNYGAGAVIVWDRGRWEAVEDPEEGMRKGKLLFDLYGHKLRGRWTLFRTKSKSGKQNEWLLMKKPDVYADPASPPGEESIQSGLTIEELREGVDPGVSVQRQLKRLKPPRADVDIHRIAPMLAEAREHPFTDDEWLFELKYDGYRMLCAKAGDDVVLRYRRGQDVTALYPEIASALKLLRHDRLILDGELVALDDVGKPSFQLLQQRVHLKRHADIQRAAIERPTALFAFDLLAYGDYDLRDLPLLERRKLLREVLPRYNAIRYSDHIVGQGEAMYQQVRDMRLEGIVAKRADSKYREGRSAQWLKIRADRTGDFAIVGYSPAKGARTGFGALHLAVHEGDGLIYAGRVGSGFDQRLLDELQRRLDPTKRPDPPCSGPVPKGDTHTWVEPHLCCEVRYKEWTAAGHLRQPVFLHLFKDKAVEDCVRLDPQPERAELEAPEPVAPAPVAPIAKTISFTNLNKVFWPADGTTKGDLIDYYRKISPWLLPYLADRPLVLTRYPDGIEGKNFFQKDAPGYAPDWIRTEAFWSEHAKREIHYFICDDEETLLYLVNMGTIPLHLWASRMAALQTPDWCILDLDPKQAPFEDVITIARYIKKLCDEIGYDCFVKTSGSTGLHVLLPLAGQLTFEQARQLGQLLARIVADELSDIATIARATAARGDRVYIDFLQNGHGKLLVSPYCVRPLPGAPVSVPLKWTEVRKGLDIRKFTIRNAPARVKRLGPDPLIAVLATEPDLHAVLQELALRLE